MLSMNRATLVGRAGGDPEVRKLASGEDMARFSLATTERFTRRDDSAGQSTEWHSIVAFGAAAKAVRALVRKGDPVLVEGRIATRSWKDRKGAEHRATEVVVSGPRGQVNVLAKRRRGPDRQDQPPGGAAPAGAAKAADAGHADGPADAVAASAPDRATDTDRGEDTGPDSEADAGSGSESVSAAEADGASDGDSPKGGAGDAEGGDAGDGGNAAATGTHGQPGDADHE